MKRAIYILLFILHSVNTNAQKIQLSDQAAINPPTNMSKLAKSEITRIAASKLNGTKSTAVSIMLDRHSDETYAFRGMLVSIRSTKLVRPAATDYFAKVKASDDAANYGSNLISTKISVVGNYEVMIVKNLSPGLGEPNSHSFYVLNKARTTIVSGTLISPFKDAAKAGEASTELINGLLF